GMAVIVTPAGPQEGEGEQAGEVLLALTAHVGGGREKAGWRGAEPGEGARRPTAGRGLSLTSPGVSPSPWPGKRGPPWRPWGQVPGSQEGSGPLRTGWSGAGCRRGPVHVDR